MKKLWKEKIILFLLLLFASDFFYSLAAWSRGYSIKIGYNFYITPNVFLISAIIDLFIFIFLFIYYGKHYH